MHWLPIDDILFTFRLSLSTISKYATLPMNAMTVINSDEFLIDMMDPLCWNISDTKSLITFTPQRKLNVYETKQMKYAFFAWGVAER